MVQTLNQLAGNSDRLLRSTLTRSRSLRLNYRRAPSPRTLERNTPPILVMAVMVGALRYVKRKDTNFEIDKKINRLVTRLNQNGRR
jgi:hypothetical protein